MHFSYSCHSSVPPLYLFIYFSPTNLPTYPSINPSISSSVSLFYLFIYLSHPSNLLICPIIHLFIPFFLYYPSIPLIHHTHHTHPTIHSAVQTSILIFPEPEVPRLSQDAGNNTASLYSDKTGDTASLLEDVDDLKEDTRDLDKTLVKETPTDDNHGYEEDFSLESQDNSIKVKLIVYKHVVYTMV